MMSTNPTPASASQRVLVDLGDGVMVQMEVKPTQGSGLEEVSGNRRLSL